jgi:hypothetical protein
MANTMTLISSSTVGAGGAANITFSSITSTYTDLVLCGSARSTRAANDDGLILRFNGESTQTNISNKVLYGDGSTTGSFSNSESGYLDGANATANTFASFQIYLPNYAGSTQKSYSVDGVTENNATSALTNMRANLWNQTSAITQLVLLPSNGSFAQYSTAYLYGIKNS